MPSTGALSAITAAVVGVIANLALWFSLHALFGAVEERRWPGMSLDVPQWSSLNLAALVLTLAAIVAVFRFKLGVLSALGAAAVAGIALRLNGLA